MKKVVICSFMLMIGIILSSCGCAYRWVEVQGHYYKPKHYEQYNGTYYSYGQWVEEQKYLRVKCACGTTKDIKVTESLYNEVQDGDSIYWYKEEHTISVKHTNW